MSSAALNRLRLIRACDETVWFIERRRAEMREELVQKYMQPGFFGCCRSRKSAERKIDMDGIFAPSYKFYAWRSLDTAKKLKSVAQASVSETVNVSADDFDDISVGWNRTEK